MVAGTCPISTFADLFYYIEGFFSAAFSHFCLLLLETADMLISIFVKVHFSVHYTDVHYVITCYV